MDPGRLRKMFTSLPGVFSVRKHTLYTCIYAYMNFLICSARLRNQSNQILNGIDHRYCVQANTLVHKVEQKYHSAQIQDNIKYV